MRVKLAQAGAGGGVLHAHPPFITFNITSKVAVYAPADTLTVFHLSEKYVHCGPHSSLLLRQYMYLWWFTRGAVIFTFSQTLFGYFDIIITRFLMEVLRTRVQLFWHTPPYTY
jgi:hypothetical protein